MPTILLVDIDSDLRAELQPQIAGEDVGIQVSADPQHAVSWIERCREPVPAIVLGPEIDEPVRLAQRIHQLDREIAVLILCHEEHHAQVGRAIQFTPFLGDYVTIHPITDVSSIAETLHTAVLRGRQRRQLHTTIAAMNEQLKTLSAHRISAVQYLDHVLDHAPIGVIALSSDSHIISSNRRAGEILEQSERELLGTSLPEIFRDDERQRFNDCLARASLDDTENVNEVLTRRTSAGAIQYVAVTATALPVGPTERGALVILQDVTSQVVTEQERETALQLRDEFLSVAAHELKTPLTSIKGFVDLLGRQLQQSQWDEERVTQLHEHLRTQVVRLEMLVTDLLDASRIQQGRLDPRPESTDLAELAQRVLQRFAEGPMAAPQHELILDAPEPVLGIWDPGRIDQVITNLVSNALKYSPDGGEIRVTVRNSGNHVEVMVRDQGVGIDSELQSRLFQPFMRGNTGGKVPGTGLGLHIVSKIVEQHEGTISVASTPGQGSTFTVQLPVNSHHGSQVDESHDPETI